MSFGLDDFIPRVKSGSVGLSPGSGESGDDGGDHWCREEESDGETSPDAALTGDDVSDGIASCGVFEVVVGRVVQPFIVEGRLVLGIEFHDNVSVREVRNLESGILLTVQRIAG